MKSPITSTRWWSRPRSQKRGPLHHCVKRGFLPEPNNRPSEVALASPEDDAFKPLLQMPIHGFRSLPQGPMAGIHLSSRQPRHVVLHSNAERRREHVVARCLDE